MEMVVNNNPAEIEARAWLTDHRAESGLSWSQLGKLTGLNQSTLSLFGGGTYTGNNDNVATKVLAYRDRLAVEAEIAADAPIVPEWYETATSRHVTGLLRYAQTGEIVLIVSGPGLGKTLTARRFAAADPNVWLATMSPSSAGVATMASEVAATVGLGEIKGSPQQLSRQIRNHVQGKKGLLIIDEAQELNDKSLNEIRSWHDRTGVGIALLGNEKTVGQIDSRKSALAQVASRFAYRHVQSGPMPGDLDALLDAWGITNTEQKTFLARIGAMPGALREVTHTLKIALIAAFGDGGELTLKHIRDAARQRNVKVTAS